MPTYEYRCPNGHQFELFQKMSDEPRAQCPSCGSGSERLLSGGVGFLLKGDGFYSTDHRSDSYKKEASKEESAGVTEKAPAASSKKGEKPAADKPPSKDSSSSGTSSTGPSSEGS
jgi:putative FmdB family regulatory protein